MFEYHTEEDANELVSSFQINAPNNFPNANILLFTRTSLATAIMTSFYSSKEMADNAMADRKPLLDEVKSKIKNIETHEGDASWLR